MATGRAPADGVDHQLVAGEQSLGDQEQAERQENDERGELAHTIASGLPLAGDDPRDQPPDHLDGSGEADPRDGDAAGRGPPAQSRRRGERAGQPYPDTGHKQDVQERPEEREREDGSQ